MFYPFRTSAPLRKSATQFRKVCCPFRAVCFSSSLQAVVGSFSLSTSGHASCSLWIACPTLSNTLSYFAQLLVPSSIKSLRFSSSWLLFFVATFIFSGPFRTLCSYSFNFPSRGWLICFPLRLQFTGICLSTQMPLNGPICKDLGQL